MGTAKQILSTLGLLIVTPIWLIGQSRQANTTGHPVYFSDDGSGFEVAKPPTNAVLQAILETPDARERADDLDESSKANLKSLFRAARVGLSRDTIEAFVVIGTFPMGGGDNDWFWIVLVQGGNARVVLFDRGNAIRIKRGRHYGLHDVEMNWFVGGRWGKRTYSFDDSKYVLKHEWSHEGR